MRDPLIIRCEQPVVRGQAAARGSILIERDAVGWRNYNGVRGWVPHDGCLFDPDHATIVHVIIGG